MKETALKEVVNTLSALGSSLPEVFSRMVLMRLEAMGCQANDAFGLAFIARKEELKILNYCHIAEMPLELYPMLCDRTCGQYLYGQKQTGLLNIETLDLSGALSSITEGDVSLSFRSGASDAEKLDALLDLMMETGKEQLACFRRIKW